MATHLNIDPNKLVRGFTNTVDDFCATLSALEPFIRDGELADGDAESMLLELIDRFHRAYSQLEKYSGYSMEALDSYLSRLVDHYGSKSMFMRHALYMSFRYLRDRKIYESVFNQQMTLTEYEMDLDMHLVYSILMIEDRESAYGIQDAHDYMFLHEESWNSGKYLI